SLLERVDRLAEVGHDPGRDEVGSNERVTTGAAGRGSRLGETGERRVELVQQPPASPFLGQAGVHVIGPGAALRHRFSPWGDHAQPELDTAADTPEAALQLPSGCTNGGIQLLF